MRTIFTDTAPIAEVRGGLVVLKFGDEHPIVTTPPHVVREFCEITMRKLDAWEAEQTGRVVAFGVGGGH
jgi:hypothetical protein